MTQAPDTSGPITTLAAPLDQLPDPLPLPGPESRLTAGSVTVRPPGSKSLTNRALLLAALADGTSTLRHALTDADDAQRMLAAIDTLGARAEHEGDALRITGVGGRWKTPEGGATVNLNNAGTATRFLTAAALVSDQPITIDGNERMRQRPIGELTDLLQTLGATCEHLMEPGCPPVKITAPTDGLATEIVEIGRTQSSQFVSALLLTASVLPKGLTLKMVGDITSASYVRMTLDLLQEVGVCVRTGESLRSIQVVPGLKAFDLDVEADASGATYAWAAGALMPGRSVGVTGLRAQSSQGDAGFAEMMERMGASVVRTDDAVSVKGHDRILPLITDMKDMPDAAVTLAVVCAFADGPSVIRGVRTLRVKETDRIQALANELAKIGVTVSADAVGDPDAMTIEPPAGGVDCSAGAPPVAFDTYDDHRMAMALSLVSLRRPNVLINDPGCVRKTYARYYVHFARFITG